MSLNHQPVRFTRHPVRECESMSSRLTRGAIDGCAECYIPKGQELLSQRWRIRCAHSTDSAPQSLPRFRQRPDHALCAFTTSGPVTVLHPGQIKRCKPGWSFHAWSNRGGEWPDDEWLWVGPAGMERWRNGPHVYWSLAEVWVRASVHRRAGLERFTAGVRLRGQPGRALPQSSLLASRWDGG